MAKQNFVFIFVKDRAYKSPAPYLLEYVRFRHPDDPRYKVLNVKDAHAFMLKGLGAADTLGKIHLYSHSNEIGYVWGRLRVRDRYQGIAPWDVLQYQRREKSAKAIASHGDAQTIVYIHGCNLGKFPEALRYWRDLFGGGKGSGIAPKRFQHFGLQNLIKQATWGRTKHVFYQKEIKHTNDINEYVISAVAQAKSLGYKLRKNASAALRVSAEKSLDTWLANQYALMLKGGELPQSKAQQSQLQIRTLMRDILNEHSGLPTTFLFSTLQETWWKNTGELRKVMKPRGAIFPDDPKWKTNHHMEKAN